MPETLLQLLLLQLLLGECCVVALLLHRSQSNLFDCNHSDSSTPVLHHLKTDLTSVDKQNCPFLVL